MATIQEEVQNRPLEALDTFFIFETINARSQIRDPLRRTSEWPQRLLHTKTMTSHNRGQENAYNDAKQPLYNIISYTWGRFCDPKGSAVRIDNVPWEIPRIDGMRHFTAEQFHAIMQRITDNEFLDKFVTNEGNGKQGSNGEQKATPQFIWVDIACIDQGDSDESARQRLEEINKQGVIFGRAQDAYIWLSHHRSESLGGLLSSLGTLARALEEVVPWKSRQQALDTKERLCQVLDSAASPIVELLSDPWFTSLWTFQEGFLRQDALLLSLEGDPAPLDEETRILLSNIIQRRAELVLREDYDLHEPATCGRYWTISTLASVFALMHRLLLNILLNETFPPSDPLYSKTEAVWSLVRCSGLNYFDTTSPFAIYHATKFRTAGRQLDRIYGCMQIFNVRLGRSVHPELFRPVPSSLEDLNNELVMWLTNRHGSSSQMFVHTRPPKPGKAWRFSLASEVTDDFMPAMLRSNRMYMGFWDAYRAVWGLHFRATAYAFERLAARWKQSGSTPRHRNPEASELEISLSLDRPAVGPLISIAMDESPYLSELPGYLKAPRLRRPEREELVTWLVEHLAKTNDLRVLLFGDFVDSLKSKEDDDPNYYCMGIIAVHATHAVHGPYWLRLGVCLWESNLFPLRDECKPGFWEHIDGLYG